MLSEFSEANGGSIIRLAREEMGDAVAWANKAQG